MVCLSNKKAAVDSKHPLKVHRKKAACAAALTKSVDVMVK